MQLPQRFRQADRTPLRASWTGEFSPDDAADLIVLALREGVDLGTRIEEDLTIVREYDAEISYALTLPAVGRRTRSYGVRRV